MASSAEAVPPGNARGTALSLGLRAVGLCLLVGLFLASATSLEETGAALANARPGPLVVGLCWFAASLAVAAVRLCWLLRSLGHRAPVLPLLCDLVQATALNLLVVAGSGELHRIRRLRSRGLPLARASAAVLVDRVVGTAAIGGAGLVGLFVLGAEWALDPRVTAGAAVGGVALALAVGLVMRRRLRRSWRRVAAHLPPLGALLAAFGLSLGTLACWVLSVIALARGLSLEVAPPLLAFAAPLVALATLLPISIGGIGVREAGYAVLLAPHGVATADAVALGLLQYAVYAVIAAAGGLGLAIEAWPRRRRAGPLRSAEGAVDAKHDLPAADPRPEDATRRRDPLAPQRRLEASGGLERMGHERAQGAAGEVALDDRGSAA